MNSILTIVLIAIAGPLIGSLLGVWKRPSHRFVHNMLAFAAGIMLAISFLELIPESIQISSILICVIGIILGSAIMFLVDKFIPHIHPCSQDEEHVRLKRTALYLIIGIFLHNFPEGIAMGLGSVIDYKFSLMVAIAIAIHDVPEGICTSAPYFYVSGQRLKSFLISFSTAIPTLVGFLLAHFLLPQIPLNIIGLIIASTAGLMIYISADELIPVSCCKHYRTPIFSLLLGVISVILLGLL